MRTLGESLARSWKWGWAFVLLIVTSTLALAFIGLRAVRAERIEHDQQLREQHARTSRLSDAAIAAACDRLQGQPFEAARGGVPFARSGDGFVRFEHQRVWFGRPRARLESANERSLSTEMLVEEARRAAGEGRQSEAEKALHLIREAAPDLREWAEFELLANRLRSGRSEAASELASARWSRSEASTPMGIPLPVFAALSVEQVPPQQRAPFVPNLAATLDALRAGRWWLDFEERRFYDRELRRLLSAIDRSRQPPEDHELERLGDLALLVLNLPRSAGTIRRFERDRQGRPVILLARSVGDDVHGIALTQAEIRRFLDSAVAPIVAGHAFPASIRASQAGLLWGDLFSTVDASPLRSIRGLEMGFGTAAATRFSQRQRLWAGLVLLLVIVELAGVAMIVRLAQRERELARSRSEFLGAVSHELNTPLTVIRLQVERLLGHRVAADSLQDYYRAIDEESQRLQTLVGRLLTAQRIEAGKHRYELSPVSIDAVATAARDRVRNAAEAKRISIVYRGTKDVPTLNIDASAMTDAIENLLENAIKYSAPGTSVDLSIDVEGGQVRIHVTDQGIGIDPEDLPHVFERFFRGRRGELRDVKGTGLGLALVESAVEAHGGSVAATSLERGSRFTITLPAPAGGS